MDGKKYYHDHNIGWVARPGHNVNGFMRAGRFKKASNMNLGLHISCQIEKKLQCVYRFDGWTDEDEQKTYTRALEQVCSRRMAESGRQEIFALVN